MKVVYFTHSLLSDWNHGNAHFLRGIYRELKKGGHSISVFEPYDSWSVQNLIRDHGIRPIRELQRFYPQLTSTRYHLSSLDLVEALADADLVIVHEWNEPSLVGAIGAFKKAYGDFRLLFHDTHHRAVTAPDEMMRFDLSEYDGILGFGASLQSAYLRRGLESFFVWHEAADTELFHPQPENKVGDVVWIGNWGDGERSEELVRYLVEPVKALGLRARVYGVRYPEEALRRLDEAGIEYGGWLPNYRVPEILRQFNLTVHIPRAPYRQALIGIPTIRPFEALACGVPLIVALWKDTENLFEQGSFLTAMSPGEMKDAMEFLVHDESARNSLAEKGVRSIVGRNDCAMRVAELEGVMSEFGD